MIAIAVVERVAEVAADAEVSFHELGLGVRIGGGAYQALRQGGDTLVASRHCDIMLA